MTDGGIVQNSQEVERYCIECGYNLRGLTADRCPECGQKIDANIASPIPWEHRKQLGRFRAYWRTVKLTIFQPICLAQAISAPVDFDAAVRFRLITTCLIAFSFAAVLFIFYVHKHVYENWFIDPARLAGPNGELDSFWEIKLLWIIGMWCGLGAVMAILSAVRIGLWGPTLLFRAADQPIVRQNRAAAVSAYACAPLLWLTPVAFLVLPWSFFNPNNPWTIMDDLSLGACSLAILVLLPVALIHYIVNVFKLLVRTTHCGPGRCIAAAIVMPCMWIVGAAVGLSVWPILMGLIFLMARGLFWNRLY